MKKNIKKGQDYCKKCSKKVGYEQLYGKITKKGVIDLCEKCYKPNEKDDRTK